MRTFSCAALLLCAGALSLASRCVVAADAVDPDLAPVRGLIERYAADRALLLRFHDAPGADTGRAALRAFYDEQRAALAAIDFDTLSPDGRIDYLLLRNELETQARTLDYEAERQAEMAALLPFAPAVRALHEARRRFEPVDARTTAGDLARLADELDVLTDQVASGALTASATVGHRAFRHALELRSTLRGWYGFHAAYDPLFTWWMKAPYDAVDTALDRYATAIRTHLAGIADGDDDTILGDPIGRAALIDALRSEFIPYDPEALVAIAEQEYAWCEREMRKASEELGYGADWKAALDYVKTLHVAPGEQPALIRSLAEEAIAFLDARDLLTIPPLCRSAWRMEMMSPERQRVSPYFLGGETIIVSYPTDTMDHDEKLMSMRGNNMHFARATVHHELIPGHHLQGYMTSRYRVHRRVFSTPFWIEGWALYWEMRLWDLGFAQSPENRIGMLFWRMHRCARIVFSLSFHLGTMTAPDAIEYLITNVGHERANATAEVRRSVSGDYGPLYQAAYMLGGLQIRALHREVVDTGRMTERDFHDMILQQNSIPIELIRARMLDAPIDRDFRTTWRFYDG